MGSILMIIKKIISGAQTGADRAALDFAIDNEIPHGGWVPKGRKAEDGPISERYGVNESPSADYSRRTELNVIDSDGTLIISHGKLTEGSALTQRLAEKHNKPCLHMDLNQMPEFKSAIEATHWINRHGIEILNVAGPRASKDPKIYDATMNILEIVFYLVIIEGNMPDFINKPYEMDDPAISQKYPETVDDAVDLLMAELPLKDKTRLAGMSENQLHHLHPSLGLYIRNNYGLLADNKKLLKSCRIMAGDNEIDGDAAPFIVIRKLWEKLKKTHRLRRIK
jgi:hypothetical protein